MFAVKVQEKNWRNDHRSSAVIMVLFAVLSVSLFPGCDSWPSDGRRPPWWRNYPGRGWRSKSRTLKPAAVTPLEAPQKKRELASTAKVHGRDAKMSQVVVSWNPQRRIRIGTLFFLSHQLFPSSEINTFLLKEETEKVFSFVNVHIKCSVCDCIYSVVYNILFCFSQLEMCCFNFILCCTKFVLKILNCCSLKPLFQFSSFPSKKIWL